MPRRIIARLLFTTTLTATIALALPAGSPAEAPKSFYPAPAPGTVRVIARKVQHDARGVEWQWVLLTEHPYHDLSISGTKGSSGSNFKLSGGDPTLRADGGGPVIYDLRFRVNSTKYLPGEPEVTIEYSMRQRNGAFHTVDGNQASSGSAVNGGGVNPLPKPMPPHQVARALLTGDQTLPLPVRLPLFERTFQLGDEKAQRLVSYLEIPK